MKLRFDHTYCMDKNFKFRTKLNKAGFYINEREVEHPGKHFCRFITFPEIGGEKQYLEFIHIGRGGVNFSLPGFSLGSAKPLKPLSKILSKNIEINFSHKNYQWKLNNKDYLPGWNFILFPKNKSKIYTWITEYEFSSKRKSAKKKDTTHPNGAYLIKEFNMQLSNQDIKLYSALLGQPKVNTFHLGSGKKIHFTKAKNSRIDSVVIETKTFTKLVRNFEWDKLISYKNKPAVVIENQNKKMWNIIITG